MPVTHLGSVNDFEECLKSGGSYKFEVTIHELPQSAIEIQGLSPLGVQDVQTREIMQAENTWGRLVRRLAALNTVWIYKRSGKFTYEVTCIIPPPAGRGRVGSMPDQ